jgi:hypothetical protein
MEKVTFTFSGGMADNHELNFYEAGRFQYGAARFIYTLEKFRQEGKIVSRLTHKVNADIRVRASQPSSFVQEVILFSAPIVAQCAVSVPFEALFSYVWDLLTPSSSTKAQDIAVELAKQEVEREKERTEQMRIMASVAERNGATTDQALTILSKAVDENWTVVADEVRATRDEIKELRNELLSKKQREEMIKEYSSGLRVITPETERRLVGQMRRAVPDMTLPLRSSAQGLAVGDARSENSFTQLDRDAAERISRESEDDTPTLLTGTVKMYDVETGYGRFRYDESKKPLSFRVPGGLKSEFRERILEAMIKEEMRASFYILRDVFGNPTSLILNDILDEEVE